MRTKIGRPISGCIFPIIEATCSATEPSAPKIFALTVDRYKRFISDTLASLQRTRLITESWFTGMIAVLRTSQSSGRIWPEQKAAQRNIKLLPGIGPEEKSSMKTVLIVALFAIFPGIGSASAADGCGPGCHSTSGGACVVDGWGTGAHVRNECPAGASPRPACGGGYVWRPRMRACFAD
jgi:hypothetical protein